MFATIKRAARVLLTAGGPDAVSVRAIAREIGVTPAAIYRYYSSIQELVDELRTDILGELDTWIEFVHDEVSGGSPTTRVSEMVKAFRRWAIEHPREFWLALSPSSPDRSGFAAVPDREPRVAARFFREFLRSREYDVPPGPQSDLTGPALNGFLSAWARLLGLVTMEISGQGKWMPVATADSEALFEAQLAELSVLLTSNPESFI
jgi:AcrR family transcriptional regulator